jgi:hypothetical protein
MRALVIVYGALITMGLELFAIFAAQVAAAQNAPGAMASATETGNSGPVSSMPACDRPGALGLARVVEIDTTGAPAFGMEHFKQYDFLQDHEVVLTFDDGPWPENTPAVLKALADQCIRRHSLRSASMPCGIPNSVRWWLQRA